MLSTEKTDGAPRAAAPERRNPVCAGARDEGQARVCHVCGARDAETPSRGNFRTRRRGGIKIRPSSQNAGAACRLRRPIVSAPRTSPIRVFDVRFSSCVFDDSNPELSRFQYSNRAAAFFDKRFFRIYHDGMGLGRLRRRRTHPCAFFLPLVRALPMFPHGGL